MTSSLEIDGKKMHSIKHASLHTGYSRDYITRLAREEKITAAQIGRNWFVDLDSLAHYSTTMALEQKVRQQQLSDERKRERQLQELIEKKQKEQTLRRRHVALRSKVVAVSVLVLGLLCGVAIEKNSTVALGLNRQVASAPFVHWFDNTPLQESDAVESAPAPTPEGAEVLNFSHEAFRLSTLAEQADGILLMPSATSATSAVDIKNLFSDDVKIFTDENGQEYVAQVDESGKMLRRIPFVVVPVSTEKTL